MAWDSLHQNDRSTRRGPSFLTREPRTTALPCNFLLPTTLHQANPLSVMENINIPHEVSVSLEALMSLLTSDTHVVSIDSHSDSMTPTLSSSSSCSNGGGFEIRRAARRLDRALQGLETALEKHEEAGEDVTVGPLIQADLVAVLTSLAQALDAQPSVEWRSHDVLQLYEDLALTAVRILTMHDSFLIHQEEQLDALVDRIAVLLLQDEQASSSGKVLNALVTCVNRHLIHVEGSNSENPILFPLLQALETLQLLKIVLQRCSQDMSRRWNPHEEDGRLDLWSFCSFLLKHLAGSRGDDDVHGWLQNRFMEDVDARVRYTTPHILATDVNDFLDSCRTFGVELIEITLEVLDRASIEMTVTDHAHEAIRHTSLVYSTAQVLEKGLEVALPFSMLRSIFTAYAPFVAIFSHKFMEQEGDITKMVACDILVDLANFVLKNPQSRSMGFCDSNMETAVSITLLSTLDSCGIKDEMTPILEYMRDQGQSSAEWPTAKKPRRVDQDDSSFESTHAPFTDILQASVMASVMLPNTLNDATLAKHSVARLVQSYSPKSVTDPWHSLVARKVKETFAIDLMREDEDTSDRILQKYVMDHQKSTTLVHHKQSEATESNVLNGN